MPLAIRPDAFANHVIPAFDDITSAFANAATAERAYQREQSDKATKRRETLEDREAQRKAAKEDAAAEREAKLVADMEMANYNLELDRVKAQDKRTMEYQKNIDQYYGEEGAWSPEDYASYENSLRLNDAQVQATNALAEQRAAAAAAGGKGAKPGLSADMKRMLDERIEPEIASELLSLGAAAGYAVTPDGKVALDDHDKAPRIADHRLHAQARVEARARVMRRKGIDPDTYEEVEVVPERGSPFGGEDDFGFDAPRPDNSGLYPPTKTGLPSTMTMEQVKVYADARADRMTLDEVVRKLESGGVVITGKPAPPAMTADTFPYELGAAASP